MLLDRCTTTIDANGDPVALDAAGRSAVLARAEASAAEGLRVLAVADRELDPGEAVPTYTRGGRARPVSDRPRQPGRPAPAEVPTRSRAVTRPASGSSW